MPEQYQYDVQLTSDNSYFKKNRKREARIDHDDEKFLLLRAFDCQTTGACFDVSQAPPYFDVVRYVAKVSLQ